MPCAHQVVEAGAGGGVSASLAADDAAVNRLLLELVRVGEANGVKFPREFGLLLKQVSAREPIPTQGVGGGLWVDVGELGGGGGAAAQAYKAQ